MADEDTGGVLPMFDPDAADGPRRATYRPPVPKPGEDGDEPVAPPLPPWLSAPAPDPSQAAVADAPPPPRGVAPADLPPPAGIVPSAVVEHEAAAPESVRVEPVDVSSAEPVIADFVESGEPAMSDPAVTMQATSQPATSQPATSQPATTAAAEFTDPTTGAIVRAMSAAELQSVVDAALQEPGGTARALEQFEQQLRLRGIDVPPASPIEVPEAASTPDSAREPGSVREPEPVGEPGPVREPEPVSPPESPIEPPISVPSPGAVDDGPPELIEPRPESVEDRVEAFGAGLDHLTDTGIPDAVDETATRPDPLGDEADPLPVAAPPSELDAPSVESPSVESLLAESLPAESLATADPIDSGLDLSGFTVIHPGADDVPMSAEPATPEAAALVGAGVAATMAAAPATSTPAVAAPLPDQTATGSTAQLPAARRSIVEIGAIEPTPDDLRVGRAARMFWLWFPVNASLVMVAVGATLLEPQGSLRQAVLAVLGGVALAFIPIGFATMAAKRAGQPTMIVSRGVFGHLGNLLPALIALVTRIAWGGLLVWIAGVAVAGVLGAAGMAGAFAPAGLVWIGIAASLVVAVAVAVIGARVITVVQAVLTVLSLGGIAGFVVLTADRVDLPLALQRQDGPWASVLSGAVLVFAVVGLAWAMSGGDLARYQRSSTGSAGSMLFATLGATLPPFVLIGYGALLAASDEELGGALMRDPAAALTGLLPPWAAVPILVAIVGSLISGAILALYSAGLAVQAAGVAATRPATTTIAAIGVVIAAAILAVVLPFGLATGLALVLVPFAVPIAAWTGLLAGDVMMRSRPYDVDALLHRGRGVPDVVWSTLIAFVAIAGLGLGLVPGQSWTGWLLPLLDGTGFETAPLGVPVALVLGIVVGLLAGIRHVRAGRAAPVAGAVDAE